MDDWGFGPAQELRRAFILDDGNLGPIYWYRPGKSAAVAMSVDDIFPGTSQSAYEAGGDLEKGALGRLLWLLERHPQLRLHSSSHPIGGGYRLLPIAFGNTCPGFAIGSILQAC